MAPSSTYNNGGNINKNTNDCNNANKGKKKNNRHRYRPRRRRPATNPNPIITVRDPEAESNALITPSSPTSTSAPAPANPFAFQAWMDELGAMEQGRAGIVSADRTLARIDTRPEDADAEEVRVLRPGAESTAVDEECELIDAAASNASSEVLVSGATSPQDSMSGSGIFRSLAGSVTSLADSFKSGKSRSGTSSPTQAVPLGDEVDDGDLQIIENYWDNSQIHRAMYLLGGSVMFRPPPAGKPDFDDAAADEDKPGDGSATPGPSSRKA